MIDHMFIFDNSIIILMISIIIGSIEIERYYKEDGVLRKIKDIHIHTLSTTGTICIMAAIASLTVLIVTGLDYYKIINF